MHIEYDSIKTFISTLDTADSWVKIEFPQYAIADAKNKGEIGEKIFYNLCLENGKDIIWNKNNDDHDFILNGYFKVELKFSLASTQKSTGKGIVDKFTFNHIAAHKNWDYLVLMGVNPPRELSHERRGCPYQESIRLYTISKQDFKENLDYHLEQGLIGRQQGGRSGGNDDYMVGDYYNILNWRGIKPLNEII